jgi:hypothetical protein
VLHVARSGGVATTRKLTGLCIVYRLQAVEYDQDTYGDMIVSVAGDMLRDTS